MSATEPKLVTVFASLPEGRTAIFKVSASASVAELKDAVRDALLLGGNTRLSRIPGTPVCVSTDDGRKLPDNAIVGDIATPSAPDTVKVSVSFGAPRLSPGAGRQQSAASRDLETGYDGSKPPRRKVNFVETPAKCRECSGVERETLAKSVALRGGWLCGVILVVIALFTVAVVQTFFPSNK
ncbi:hypothetical protein HDU83_000712 [Entophlyctis luteolus]|nr:hypothetical protein HDU82_007491 [Entophlyctis luteolus]KAJ3349236.1 hypothetical protein HDU83_000712 [Entophlyctis luteolus]